jgi:hypothetical protein
MIFSVSKLKFRLMDRQDLHIVARRQVRSHLNWEYTYACHIMSQCAPMQCMYRWSGESPCVYTTVVEAKSTEEKRDPN